MPDPIVYDLRGELNAQPVFGSLGPVKAVTVHHTVSANPLRKRDVIALIEQFNAQHRAKGWGGIGYHYVVDRLGRVYQTRSTSAKGAHVGGWNSGNVGVAFLGDYSNKTLNLSQRRAMRYLVKKHGVKVLGGHREWPPPGGSTACPGRILENVKSLRREWGLRAP